MKNRRSKQHPIRSNSKLKTRRRGETIRTMGRIIQPHELEQQQAAIQQAAHQQALQREHAARQLLQQTFVLVYSQLVSAELTVTDDEALQIGKEAMRRARLGLQILGLEFTATEDKLEEETKK
jgi:hypothetical protein